jgi:hypothetical protein
MRQHVIAVLLSSLAIMDFVGVHRTLAADRSLEILKEIAQVKFPEQDPSGRGMTITGGSGGRTTTQRPRSKPR